MNANDIIFIMEEEKLVLKNLFRFKPEDWHEQSQILVICAGIVIHSPFYDLHHSL